MLNEIMRCSSCGKSAPVLWNPYNKVVQCHHCGQIKNGFWVMLVGWLKHRFRVGIG